jgi:4-diphosphocytidyl-2-C-methyl-D-erythritol kinase
MKACPNVKINVGLHVLRKRPDGYHDLETLFVPYPGICDELEIEEAGEFSFDGEGVTWENDLTVQAYKLLKDDFDLPPVAIRLTKRAPVGAGLGGGSSDAAFALMMLDSLFDLGLGQDRLAAYAARLGSDCAFFIYNRPMVGRGRGEILSPCPVDLSPYRIEITVPQGVSVSTREAYGGIVPRERPVPIEEILSLPVAQWRGLLENDFEPQVFALYPELARLKQDFYERGALYAAMSGSGSAIYGIFKK